MQTFVIALQINVFSVQLRYEYYISSYIPMRERHSRQISQDIPFDV